MPPRSEREGFFGKSPYSLPSAAYGGGRKRIFIGLLAASCFALCLLVSIFLIWPWLLDIPAWLPVLSLGLGISLIILLAWLCLSLVFHLYTGRPIMGMRLCRHALTGFFLPCMQIMGSLAGIDRASVQKSFVKINNELMLAEQRKVPAQRIMLLLPHCLQASSCRRRLTHDPDNCGRCGRCPVGPLLDLRDKYGFRFAIATGGTVARRIIVKCRPQLIIAVACERDLASGIQDSYPLPVFGILNERPCGPCMDTLVDAAMVEHAVKSFVSDVEC